MQGAEGHCSTGQLVCYLVISACYHLDEAPGRQVASCPGPRTLPVHEGPRPRLPGALLLARRVRGAARARAAVVCRGLAVAPLAAASPGPGPGARPGVPGGELFSFDIAVHQFTE